MAETFPVAAQCRLIDQLEPAEAAFNMAMDESIYESAQDSGVCSLRLYRWHPTLSLGYFQRAADRVQHQASADCPLVRRRSGGGAILHHHEITYSFACPLKPRAKTTELYDLFHRSIVETLSRFGISASMHRAEDGLHDDAFLCFQRRAVGDIVLQGHKVTGSAQRRNKGACLQHGSILLARSKWAPELPGIGDLTRQPIDQGAFVACWTNVLADFLKTEFETADLDDKEKERAEQIRQTRFATDEWTVRR